MDRVSVFVDVQNIYYTTRQAYQRQFNYRALWTAATDGRQVVKALAYATDRADPRQRQFQNVLREIGFEVKLKPFMQRRDGSAKGDWDVGITIDVLDYAPQSEIVVLASGDGDFEVLVTKIRNDHGTGVEVFGVPSLTANALKQAASRFVPIESSLLL